MSYLHVDQVYYILVYSLAFTSFTFSDTICFCFVLGTVYPKTIKGHLTACSDSCTFVVEVRSHVKVDLVVLCQLVHFVQR